MTKMGQTRQSPPIPLKRKKGLNRMSDKAKDELIVWREVKHDRMMKLLNKFGYVPCEYCKEVVDNFSPFNYPEGHHNNDNRRENTFANCRILHRVCNQLVSDTNVKDIPSLLEE